MAGKTLKFPEGFLWGAATAAHQIEGGLNNDWSEWEKSDLRIKNLTKRGLNPENYFSGKACNSYELFDEDLRCIKEINASTYRFSIDWSRIEPEEGKWNEKGINYYKDVVKKLKSNNIQPFITLWHWPLPLWIKNKGGWENKKTVEFFLRFVEKIISELGDEVNFWTTLNEPDVYSAHSYWQGDWPPQKKNLFSYLKVLQNLLLAHKTVYQKIKSIKPKLNIGITKQNVYFEAYKNKPVNKILKKIADWWWNFYILNQLKNNLDFISINHYHHNRINYGFNKNENKIMSDFGWELYPESIYYVLIDLKKYNKPIYITEHGLADEKDKYRAWYIIECLKNIHKAIAEGVDVKSYLHWSLLDNFEWAEGFTKKFGLYSVDRKTFKRTARPSAKIYAEICKNNALTYEER